MKTPDPSSYLTIGKIGSTYGIHGWLKIHAFTEYSANILTYTPWYLTDNDKTYQPYEIEEGKPHNSIVIAKFKNIDTPESARLMTGKSIAITRSQLPALDKGEYYWSDLIGMKVINKDGRHYGDVIYLMATGSNDVLVVKNGKEQAIPFIMGDVILNVDLEKKEIQVDWEPL